MLQMSMPSLLWPARLTDPAGPEKPAPMQTPGNSSSRPAASEAKPALSPAASASDSGSAEEPAPAVAREEKRFQLPVVAVRKPASQVLVRIDVPPDLKLKPNTVVPEVILWQMPVPVQPKTELVAAAHKEEQPVHEPETPAVTPQLTVRNREQELAEFRHAAAPPVPVPTLPLPVANTTPIRLLDGIPGTRLPNSTGPVVRSPEEVHVISIPDIPVPQGRVVVLPQGNQGAPPPAPYGSDTGSGGRGASGGVGQPGAGGNGVSRSGQASNQSGGAAGAGHGGETGKSSSLDARAGNPGANSDRGPNGRNDAAAGAGGGIAPPPPHTTRIVRPKDGKYNVVVMGSSNLDAYPEAVGILSSKLVYTVYIRAGGRKEWILEFCLLKAVEKAVKLRGSTVPVEAPYPFVIYKPDLTLLNDADYLVVHGFISAAGRFEHLSALGDIDAASLSTLIGALENWEFRPASRDGEPSAVEIALIIPREPI